MTKTNESLRLFQWGAETVPGTAVAATSKMAVEVVEFEPVDDLYRPKLAKGFTHRNPGGDTPIRRGTMWRIPEMPVSYDQLHHFLAMALGTVAPTGAGPFTWPYVKGLTTVPTPKTFTLERRLTDGAAPKDNEFAYCVLSQLRLSYQIDQPLKLSAEGFARRIQASVLTPALSMPTIEHAPSPLAKCWIDSTWANLGVTLIAGQVLSADWTFKTGFKPKWSLDGRADLDFTSHVFNADDCGIDLELKTWVDAQYDTEKTAAEAATLRAIRLDILGSATREIKLDQLMRHEKSSSFAVGNEDGQDIVTMKLQDANDGTNMAAMTVVNAIGTYA